jgi:hypothetical protein
MQKHTKIVHHNILYVIYLAGFNFGGCMHMPEDGSEGLIIFTLDMDDFMVVYLSFQCILQCASTKEAYNVLIPSTLIR